MSWACHQNEANVKRWNAFRKSHPKWRPDLSHGKDSFVLRSVQLHGMDLSGATLICADIRDAKLDAVSLARARLWDARLDGAQLWDANLNGAELHVAHLVNCSLLHARLNAAKLTGANLTGALLAYADFSNADLGGVIYGRTLLSGRCAGVRITTSYGNAIFKRDVEDQEYIDSLANHWGIWEDWQNYKRRMLMHNAGTIMQGRAWVAKQYRWLLFQTWSRLTDYGRSMSRVLLVSLLIAVLFGVVYDWCDMLHRDEYTPDWGFTAIYYSIVTYTTLGFGDVTPQSKWGQVLVTLEVFLGYLSLGLVVSVLANKVARRA